MKSILLGLLFAVIVSGNELSKLYSIGSTKFMIDVYEKLVKTNKENVLLCPLSINTVLSLVQSGAGGNTAKEISKVLYLPDTKQDIEEIFANLTKALFSNSTYNLKSTNKIYVENGFNISNEFDAKATQVFGAAIESIDFQNKEQAALDINNWVKEQTNNNIKELVSPSYFDEETSAILINSLYFRAEWLRKFLKHDTSIKKFYLEKEQSVDVTMMLVNEEFNYYEDDELNVKFLEMPYAGRDISMTIVLPNDKEGLSDLEARISRVLVSPNYTAKYVSVELPKFKFESTIEFNAILKELGIISAFEDGADFSGIGANQESLKISKVIQKNLINVNECGTVAASASAVVLPVKSCVAQLPPPNILFKADHPFLFYIKSKKLDITLFIGKIVKPVYEDE